MTALPRFRQFLLVLVVITALMFMPAARDIRAAGKWYVATTGNDSNDCLTPATACATINAAIGKALASDTIYVATGTYTGSGEEAALIDKSVTLSGGWNIAFIGQTGSSVLDGQGLRRAARVPSGVTASFDRFTFQNGAAPGASGGGIYNEGILTLTNCLVTKNAAYGSGGGIFNLKTLVMTKCTLSENSANAGGGGLYTWDTASIDATAIVKNIGGAPGWSGGGGGGIDASGTLTIKNSSITGNHLEGSFYGGGIHNYSNLKIENSTISDNYGYNGSGIYHSWGELHLASVTISGNSNSGISAGATTTIANSIIADNPVDISSSPAVFTSQGYNLIETYSGIVPAPTDILGVQAQLGPSEGSPPYHPLLPASPAVNAGNSAGCLGTNGNPLTTDQRGLPRLGACDIGAYELQPLEYSAKSASPAQVTSGEQAVFTITLNNPGQTDINNVQVSDPIPSQMTYTPGSLTASSGTYSLENGVIHWNGSVAANSPVTISFAGSVDQFLGAVTNTATIQDSTETILRSASLQVNPNEITGTSLTAIGQPISGATISDDAGHSTLTNSQGAYTIGGLLRGTYKISASSPCFTFTPLEQTVTVPPSAGQINFIGQSRCAFLPVILKPCSPLYADNFSNPNSGWPVGDDGKNRVEYLNGEYRILVRPKQWGLFVRPGFQAVDYSVAVDLRNVNRTIGSYGIAFGISADWSTLYTLEIYRDSWFGIYRWDPDDIHVLSEAPSTAIIGGKAVNHIKVERNGASIRAYANGQLLAEVFDGSYMGTRYVGLVAFSYSESNVDIRYDNFSVYSIRCARFNSLSCTPVDGITAPDSKPFELNEIEKSYAKSRR